ncbi:DUF6415 family natural product biosynthesis protein [Streptomyces afghaniensis]|uniref:DUF6415 family natural product biosynthesis protein n=1 Tax=Streptomyces afghaniensis TaxID=66865 RepID=UPI0037D0AD93
MNATAPKPPSADKLDPDPVDIATMRQTAEEVIANAATITDADEMETTILLLRGMIMLLIPEVEVATGKFPRDDVPSICARACLTESRTRLRLVAGNDIPQQVAHAQRLARSVRALADHYVNLGGGQ